jgi:hypothetical protein
VARPDLAVRERGIRAVPRLTLTPGQHWRTSLVLLLGLSGAVYGMHTILSGSVWFFQLFLVCVLVLGSAAGTRLVSRRRWLPPVVSVVATLAVFTGLFVPGTAVLAVIPTPDSIAAFGRLFQASAVSINEQSLPANADTPLLFLLCVGVAATALIADDLAIGSRLPALAGLTLIVLLAVPGIVDPGSTDPLAFIGAAIVYLLLLRIGTRQGQGLPSLGIGAAVIVLTLVVPLVLPAVDQSQTVAHSGNFGTGVNPVLSLGSDLRQSAARTVLTYNTTSGSAHYLRLVSIDNFTGTNWAPNPVSLRRGDTVDKIGQPPGLTDAVARTADTTTVTVKSLSSAWLPLPYPSSKVTGLTGSWYWDVNGLAVSSTDRNSSKQTYQATDVQLAPTPEQLLTSGTTVPAGFEKYLAIPKGLPSVVTNTAKKIVGTAPTNYEKALLLQSFFHDGDFEYSETAPVDNGYDGTGGDVIAKFLKAKSGYCIHFASAMAVMARSLGIPARIAVGFLPGKQIAAEGRRTAFEVSSHDLHAWPELYFDGVGWIRFEPTVSRGDVPSYADLAQPNVPAVSATANSATTAPSTQTKAPAPETTAAPTSSAIATGGTTTRTSTDSSLLTLLVLLVIIVLALVPAAIRSVQRARRLRRIADRTAPVLTAWTEVLQTSMDVGAAIPDTLTPREVAAVIGGGVASASGAGTVLTRVADPALTRLVDALERERFAQNATAYPGAVDDTRHVVSLVTRNASRRSRVLAVLFPTSIWRRIVRAR